MTVVLDTSVLAAYFNTGDRVHNTAVGIMDRILSGGHGTPVLCDYVLDETLTLLQRRTGRPEHAERVLAFVSGRPARVRFRLVEERQVHKACGTFVEHFRKGLSFTDCVLVHLANDVAAKIASFDAGFDGLVERISS